jgi:sporulation protein YlmC with PRC-barrel domain
MLTTSSADAGELICFLRTALSCLGSSSGALSGTSLRQRCAAQAGAAIRPGGRPREKAAVTLSASQARPARPARSNLIASNKVEGTAVYNRQGETLGEVYNFMVGKRSGQVAYAIMSFGGFLGIGQKYHPLPWNALTYDTSKKGYVVDADKERLMSAPSYAAGEEPFSRPEYGQQVRDYWSSGLT